MKQETLALFPEAAALYLNSDLSPHGMGDTLKNPAYAHFLETIIKEGWRSFYNGKLLPLHIFPTVLWILNSS